MRIDPDTYHPPTEAWSRRRATSPPHDPKGAVGASCEVLMVAIGRTIRATKGGSKEDHGFRDNAVFPQEFFWAFTAFNDQASCQRPFEGL